MEAVRNRNWGELDCLKFKDFTPLPVVRNGNQKPPVESEVFDSRLEISPFASFCTQLAIAAIGNRSSMFRRKMPYPSFVTLNKSFRDCSDNAGFFKQR